ncbi:MAG: hypothetical protein Q7S87_03185 [Agitococcus sp.]|nr:hypothetical protein [Agitococcus sp.]MDO9178640.1 hypothetical protein [Agitococcus sp.]
MNRFTLTLAQLNLKPIGHDTQGPPESILIGQLNIAGLPCHVSAYQVVEDDAGRILAVNQNYADELDAVLLLTDESPMKLCIDDLEYVIAIYPYSK